MSKEWMPVWPHEAVKGETYMNFRILAVSKKTHFRAKVGRCPVFPNRILHPGEYSSILIDTSDPLV